MTKARRKRRIRANSNVVDGSSARRWRIFVYWAACLTARSATTPVEVESNAEKAWAGLLQRQSKSNQMLKRRGQVCYNASRSRIKCCKAWAGLPQRQSKSNQMLQGVGRSATTPVEVESNAARRGQVCYNASRSRIKCCKAWAGLLQRQSKSNQMLQGVGRSATTPVEVESNAEQRDSERCRQLRLEGPDDNSRSDK
ncbi:hypothetical protein DAPPUDRAFT_119263 [Daphnia pulex]|uniref:Uncharacterized protein n=1 Tax=Daphnia pulex TaxID=6669 RepID=E9HXZ6_DAPPU|nr:hypothetical protein DAPPUDRAFT_120817 [Daphnia pulex]EFX63384.1 hypothetical protein DAPPUDRAFT_119263 [Daphnia pulex]|eukprot:EFX61884.1 hypothetical protein DAPPUDRAFT_120817 [Daphnia pulex]